MSGARWAGAAAALLVAFAATLGWPVTDSAPADEPPQPVELCATSDPRLAELSGLVADSEAAGRRYAITDGGRRAQVYQLSPDCKIQQVIGGGVDPFDVEDLARTADGVFWLADTGDNDRQRATVALIALRPGGATTLHRLSYPDGPHDAEALLMDRDGVPLLVTKELSGTAGVYRPEGPLADPGPTALRRVGQVVLPQSSTVGGPAGNVGAILVTGGATTADGRLAALRSYTDAWLYPAPDGDLVAALGRPPIGVALPGEPQGEAIAFEPDGSLLSGSESPPGTVGKLRRVAGAVTLAGVPQPETAPPVADPAAPPEQGLGSLQAAVVALGLAALIVFGFGKLRRKK